jgi:hypothetical protein
MSGPTNRMALRCGRLRQNTNMRAKGGAIRGYGPSAASGDGYIKGNSLGFPGGASPVAPKSREEKPAALFRLEARSPKRRCFRRVTSPQYPIHLAFPPGLQLASRIV